MLAHAVETHVENAMHAEYLGSVGTVGVVGAGGLRGLDGNNALVNLTVVQFQERAQKRYSWQTYHRLMLDEEATAPEIVCLLYAALLQSRFNLRTLSALASIGIPLMQVPGVRMFIYQEADTILLCPSGPDSMNLAVGHGQINSGINAQQAVYTMHASMHAGLIMKHPERLEMIYSAVLANFLGGRNLEPVRKRDDILSVPNAMDRRSVIFVPLPLGETRFTFPITANREAPYVAPNQRTNYFSTKISITDCLRHFLDPDNWDRFLTLNQGSAQYYQVPMQMATHLNDACIAVPNNLNPDAKMAQWIPGTGPFGPPQRNCPNAALAYMGLGTFPVDAPDIPA
jgi:hypothetical protein